MAVIAKRKAKKLNIFEQLALDLLDGSDDYEKDCNAGGALAWRFIEDYRKSGMPGGLTSVVLALMEHGKPSRRGRIVGFCSVFNDCAMVPFIGPSPESRARLGL
jgi:hypothetical protein